MRKASRTHFVIIGHPRSGSTLLTSALREHPSIRMYGEVFQDDLEARKESLSPLDKVYQDGADGATYLNQVIFAKNNDPDLRATGFKLFYTQARESAARSAWGYLRERTDILVIHLVRDNTLDAFVSLLEAEKSGNWVLELNQERSMHTLVHIDHERCLKFLDEIFVYREWVRYAFRFHQVLELSYERHLVANFDIALNDVQEFIEVPCQQLPILLKKQGVGTVETRVVNYNEACSMLRNTIHSLS